MESGFLSLELQELKLSLGSTTQKELQIRVDVSVNSNNLTWYNLNSANYSTSILKCEPIVDESDNSSSQYIVGFDQLLLRTSFLELSNENIGNAANDFLRIKVSSINEVDTSAAPVGGKVSKGASSSFASPTEETLVELILPFHELFKAKGCTIVSSVSLNVIDESGIKLSKTSGSIDLQNSSFSFKVNADNGLAEFVMGSKMITWSSAQLPSPPHIWHLHYSDVIDPKAKVPPTATELRSKYLENIQKLVDTQEKIAKYTFEIGTSRSSGPSDEDTLIREMFPSLELSGGKISFDIEEAKIVEATEDIRLKSNLWSIKWDPSPSIFLHRSQVRKIVNAIQQDPSSAYIPLTVKKIPTPESISSEGGELFATALIDVAKIITTGVSMYTFKADLQGDLMSGQDSKDNSATGCFLSMVVSSPLVPKPFKMKPDDDADSKFNSLRPVDVASSKVISSTDPNRDVETELREEIKKTIERVAQEYLTIYPNPTTNTNTETKDAAAGAGVKRGSTDITQAAQPPPSSPSNPASVVTINKRKSNSAKNKDENKSDFLNFLKSNGTFHELKESMRSKVDLVMKSRYGDRGQALGKSEVLTKNEGKGVSDATVNAALSELYVFLIKECNLVINSIFSDTLIERDADEIQKNAQVDDEEETILQKLDRLLNQAENCFADERYEEGEDRHLERIQIVSHSATLSSDTKFVHDVYLQYAQFLLTQSAAMVMNCRLNDMPMVKPKSAVLLQKARESLAMAMSIEPNEFETALLYVGLLIQLNELEAAEDIMLKVLAIQLSGKESSRFGMNSFQEFDGYDSDEMVPIDPKCYAVLSALFSMKNIPLKARKALLLANRSYVESNREPAVTTHGTPRRTIILILAETSLYFLKFSMNVLGNECVKLALDCEAAVTEKALALGKPTTTVPHIRSLLKQAQAYNSIQSWSISSMERGALSQSITDAIDRATECTLIADEPIDKIQGQICLALTYQQSENNISFNDQKSDSTLLVSESFLAAIQVVSQLPSDQLERVKEGKALPLSTILKVSKLLINRNSFDEALSILLFAASLFNSASLFLYMGVCCYRINQFEDAEDAILESNLLDNRIADTWGHLCLLCLTTGPHRLVEADQCRLQTIRLNLSSVPLLRELASAYIAVDKLQIAEDLIRRALQIDYARSSPSGIDSSPQASSSHLRKMLADVLVGQNLAASAIEEYNNVLSDDQNDIYERLEASERCKELLVALGRLEEIPSLNGIINSLRGVLMQNNENVETS